MPDTFLRLQDEDDDYEEDGEDDDRDEDEDEDDGRGWDRPDDPNEGGWQVAEAAVKRARPLLTS